MTARPNRGLSESLRRNFKRIFARPFSELSRSGRIMRTLWDAAQLQNQQKEHYRRIGEIASRMVRDGTLQNIKIERIMAKIEQSERLMKRQDLVLKGYQDGNEIRDVLSAGDDSEALVQAQDLIKQGREEAALVVK